MQSQQKAGSISVFLEMIKFPHTVFALPFALVSALIAAGGIPSFHQLFWIVAAMVGARTFAMALNRLIDADIDARNPRTSSRAIPAGLIGKRPVMAFILLSGMLMIYAAWKLNPLCLKLSPAALFFLVLYSYCKRFTSLAHLVLGICLAAAPAGAWAAIRGTIEFPAVLLALAVLFWVAGFDILYALQDIDFDRNAGLHSIPAKFGIRASLMTARVFHSAMIMLLALFWRQTGTGFFFGAGIIVAALLLLYEHYLLKDADLGKLDTAFFNMNGYISMELLIFTVLETVVRS